jgi:hypothetical protein
MNKFLLFIAIGCFFSATYADQFRTIRTTGKLALSKNPAYEVQTLSAGATNVNVANGLVVVTGLNTGATAITTFTNMLPGNIVTIVGNSATTRNATTIADSGSFKLSAAFTASANKVLRLLVVSSGNYVEVGRGDN